MSLWASGPSWAEEPSAMPDPSAAPESTTAATASTPPAAPATRTVVVDPKYKASGFHSFWLGEGYRDIWSTPVTVPVLDLETYAGGLKPVRQVGQRQTPGLALVGPDKRAYTFRSLRKEPERALPEPYRKTWVAWVVHDHTAAQHPGAALLLPPLAEAVGLLHTEPKLVVMDDDPALGSFRDVFANEPGTIDEYPLAGPDVPPFHGATEIINSRALWTRWLQGPENRVDSRAFLRARILDLYVENWDRHRGQWRWVRLPGNDRWEPLAEDPDMAFNRNDGFATGFLRSRNPKLVLFDHHFDKRLEGPTINGSEMDRWLLTDLDRAAFEEVARETAGKFTDDVIEQTVQTLPVEWQRLSGDLSSSLRARRGLLADYVMRYYRDLAKKVDIHATDKDEVVSIHRGEGGAVDVSVSLAGGEPYYQRRFVPSETDEVRIYLHGGNDRVERTGSKGGPILVRVLAGQGDDVVDDSKSGGTDVWSGSGALALQKGHGTDTHREWRNPEPDTTALWLEPRNWGHWSILETSVAYGGDLGLVPEVSVLKTNWGFRSLPEAKQQRLSLAWSTGVSRGRIAYQGIFRRPASSRAFRLDLLGSGIEQFNFFGFGNETTVPERIEEHRTEEQVIFLQPSVQIDPSHWLQVYAGPTYRASWSPTDRENVLNAVSPYGSGQFAEAGVRAGLDYDTRGQERASSILEEILKGPAVTSTWRLEGFYVPPVLDVEHPFGGVEGEVVSYLGRNEARVQLAARAGGRHVWGEYPWFESAFLGGRSSLPGYSRARFAGDTSLYGGLEAHTWLFSVNLFRVGVLGLADVGRVWLDGENSDTWHDSFGAGGMIQPIATNLSLTGFVAWGEDQTKVYFATKSLF
jgi:hypothetical protein